MPTSAYETNIKDETIPKSCLVLFDDLFFDSSDFTDSGVTFSQYFNTSDDLTYGDCPSDTLSFSVVGNGDLSGYSFGQCQAYLGVPTAVDAYAFGDINAHIETYNHTYTASRSGLYRDGTRISSAIYESLIGYDTTIWAVGTNYSAKVDDTTGAIATYIPNRFMAAKLRKGMSAIFHPGGSIAYVWDGENVTTYSYVPMGVYNVEKPRSTAGDVVAIDDAHDNMILFDRDGGGFIKTLRFPCTLSNIYTALCDYVGVRYASSGGFPYAQTEFPKSPFADSGCTCRDILWWIAERGRRVAHFSSTGILELRQISTTVRETLTASDVGYDDFNIAEYVTPQVTGVLLKGMDGTSLTYGAMDNPYVISANPFVTALTVEDQQAYMDIPTYVPIELTVLEADPSIPIGGMISVRPMAESIAVLADVYNEAYADSTSGNPVFAMQSPTYTFPLMNRVITFEGGIRAKYSATGNEQREADISNTEYNATIAPAIATEKLGKAMTQENIFNALTNNGQTQGIYLYEGRIYINSDYMRAGTITGVNIDIGNGNFKVDGETGAVTMKAGTINIKNLASAGSSVITLEYRTNYYAQMCAGRFVVSNSDNGHITQYEGGGILIYDYANYRLRMSLTPENGLRFYDANGNLTKSYPAT